MRVPGGGASCLGVGRPLWGALPPPAARPLGGLPGPTTHWLWVRGAAGVGTRHQPHSALSCVPWGRHEGAWGGRLLPGCGASGVGRSPAPDCPPSGRAAGALYPLALGAGGCGRGDPSTTPQRACFARCGSGMRVPGGGASCLGVGRPGSGALPPPTARPLGGLPGPTTHWLWVRGGAGVGTRHQPHSVRSCVLALRAVGAARGRPGGAPAAWVWGVRGRALSHPRLPALWAGCRGPLPSGCGCGGVRAWGPVTNPTACLLCALWGRHEGAVGGAPLAWVWGVRGRALSHPRLPALWACCQGPLPTGCGCGGVRAWGPVTNPTARALACCGGGMWVLGGGASCLGVGRPGSGALPPPTARPLGGLPGPNTHWLLVRGVRAWGPVTNPIARGLASWLCVLWGRHEGARGGRLLPGYGLSGVGRSPTPDCPPSGRAARAHYPLAVGARGCGRGDPLPTPERALLRAVGAAGGCPGGAPLAWVWGVRGRALSGPRLPGLRAGCRGPLPTGCGCGGVRAWGRVTNPTARALACCAGGMWVPGGGASGLGVGRPGSGALPTPTARPLGGLPGPTTHWLWARVGAGVGTRHQCNSPRSCELALRAVGAARGRPGGAPPAWVWGVGGWALFHLRLPALWAAGLEKTAYKYA